MAANITPDQASYQLNHIKDNNGRMIIIVSSVLTGFATFFTVLRFYSRWLKKAPVQWDDWLCIPGLAMVVWMCVETSMAVQYGLGKHYLATDLAQVWRVMKVTLHLTIAYTLVHFFVKMSILLSYMRIFKLSITRTRLAVYVVMAYVTLWSLIVFVLVLVQCQPISLYWERYQLRADFPKGHCLDSQTSGPIVGSAMSIVGDVLVLILPIHILSGLQMKLKKKLMLISVFCIGIIACGAAITRLVYTRQLTHVQADATWVLAYILLYTIVEAALGLMCACFPAIWPLIKEFVDRGASRNTSKLGSSDAPRASESNGTSGVEKTLWAGEYGGHALSAMVTRETDPRSETIV